MKRETTRVEVWSLDFWKQRQSFADFISEVVNAFEDVPPEYRASVKLYVDGGDHEDSAYVNAFYERPETDGEMAARVAKEQEYEQQAEARERQAYARLKAKFDRET